MNQTTSSASLSHSAAIWRKTIRDPLLVVVEAISSKHDKVWRQWMVETYADRCAATNIFLNQDRVILKYIAPR